MQRKFPYNTVGKVLSQLNTELREQGIIKQDDIAITRASYYRIEKRHADFPKGKRSKSGKPWRIYSDDEVKKIIEIIKNEYWG